MRFRPTRCGRHFVQAVFLIQRPVWKPDVTGLSVSDLVPLAQMGDQSLFQVIPYPAQRLAAITIVKVAHPAFDRGVDFVHHTLKGHDRPFSFRKFGDPVFNFPLGFPRWLDMGVMPPCLSTFPHPGRKSKKVKLPGVSVDNLRLGLIQGKLQPLQNLPQDGHCLLGFALSTEDDNIVRIPDDASAQPLPQITPRPYPVQNVQIEIGQQRRNNPALRRPLVVALAAADVPLLTVLPHFHDRRLQPHPDQAQNRPVADTLGDHGH